MSDPQFDTTAAHRYYSAHCFNSAWDLLDKEVRSAEEDEQMLALSLASTWHWSQREDCTAENLSVGNWQTSRIYSVLGQGENALRYGRMCLQKTSEDAPFYLGNAHEAIARAQKLLGATEAAAEHLALAADCLPIIDDEQSREMLEKDLGDLK